MHVEIFRETLHWGGVVIDLGASFGYFSILAAQLVGPSGKVYSFEPEPIGFRNLLKNAEINKLHNISAYNLAVSDEEGVVNLYGGACGSTMIPSIANEFYPQKINDLSVSAVTVDNFLKIEKQVALIKIDIEGAEIKAFRGMSKLLNSNSNTLILSELVPKMIEKVGSVEEYFNTLQSLGFNYFYDITGTTIQPLKLPQDIEPIKSCKRGHQSLGGLIEILSSKTDASALMNKINKKIQMES